ncbi:MAG TPA: hypothetical protein VJS42_21290 [Steroidobacteraceae bacterium]|nr:hypothetical protein [Steroidobacteraceae bacterium]
MKRHVSIVLAGSAIGLIALALRADTLPDPTRPAALYAAPPSASTVEPTIRVEAIMRSGARYLAIVNGQLVRPGDRVNGALIRDIDADGLRYELAGGERVAKLPARLQVRRMRPQVAP